MAASHRRLHLREGPELPDRPVPQQHPAQVIELLVDRPELVEQLVIGELLLGLPVIPPDLLEDLLQAVLPIKVLEEIPGVEARHELDGRGVQRACYLDAGTGAPLDQLQHVPGRVQKVKRHIPQVIERGYHVGPPRHAEVVDDHVAGDQFGDGLLLPPGQRTDSVQDLLVANVRLDLILGAPSLDQLDDVQAAALDQVVQLVDGKGPVLRMQQQVYDAGLAEFLMVPDDVLAALEPIRLRQAVQHDFGVRELGLQIGCIEVDEAQQLLQLIHARAPDRKSTRLNSSHSQISYAVFCLKKKKRRNG